LLIINTNLKAGRQALGGLGAKRTGGEKRSYTRVSFFTGVKKSEIIKPNQIIYFNKKTVL